MDFEPSPASAQTCARMWQFMRDEVFPAEPVWAAHLAEHGPHSYPPVMEHLKEEARARGLWNLFASMSNVDYAAVAEVTGWSPVIAPEAINCQAPTPATWRRWNSSAARSRSSAGSSRCWPGGSAPPSR